MKLKWFQYLDKKTKGVIKKQMEEKKNIPSNSIYTAVYKKR